MVGVCMLGAGGPRCGVGGPLGVGDEGSQPNRESDHGGRGRGAGPSLPFWLAGLQMDAFTTN